MSTSAPDPPRGGATRVPRAAAMLCAGIAGLVALAAIASSHLSAGSPGRPTPLRPTLTAAARPVAAAAAAPPQEVQIGAGGPQPRAGVSMVVDPSNPAHLVAAINDYNAPQGMSVFLSEDGGDTWRPVPLPRIQQAWIGDPQVAYGPRGVLYLAGTGYDRDRADLGQAIHLAINLFGSDDGGRSWVWMGRPSGSPPRPPLGDDFPALAVDEHSGRIALAWTHLLAGTQEAIAVTTSDDGGRHFSRPGYLPAQPAEGVSALFAGTAALVVAFMDRRHGSMDVALPGGRVIRVAPLREIHTPLPGLAFRVESYPHLARDARRGRLYLAWASWEHGHAQILVCSSSDGGTHWSIPAPVAADAGHDSFMPAMSVSPSGVLVLALLRRAGPSGTTYHAYLTTSSTCGRTFGPLRQLDAASPLLGPHLPAYLGDYTALAVSAGVAHPAWTGLRQGIPVILTQAVPIPTTASAC